MEKDFLQSVEWRKFQEATGRRVFCVTSPQPSPYKGEGVFVIEHRLPIVGKYFYIPRLKIEGEIKNFSDELIGLAKKEKAGWIRFDAENKSVLEAMKNNTYYSPKADQSLADNTYQILKAPHDMQPRQVFVIDITKSEEQLLVEMKSKTRYNVRLAEKKRINLRTYESGESTKNESKKYIEEFLRLNRIMAARQGIATHPDEYYRKMFEIIPKDKLKLYAAEYNGNIVAANIVVFYGKVATYLHGASDDKYKNLMAPYLLQWRAILDAKKARCEKYDFGGIKTIQPHPNPLPTEEREQAQPSPLQGEDTRRADEVNSWAGITRFKLGFSPKTIPTRYMGSYDIIINPIRYKIYKVIQKIKSWIK